MKRHQRVLCELLRPLRPLRLGVEIGVYRGETSAVLLREFPELHLYLVDSWAVYPKDHPYRRSGDGAARLTIENQFQNMLAAMAATEFAAKRQTIYTGPSLQAAEQYCSGTPSGFDFVFLDADHTYEAVKTDLAAWWPGVRPGGLFCGHDYDHPREKRGLFGVKRAVDEFAVQHGLRIAVCDQVWSTRKL